MNGINDIQGKIEKNLSSINISTYQWKMIFTPDITKQAKEVIFSVKNIKPIHPTLTFNNVPFARVEHTKHLGVYLDNCLNFSKHIRGAIVKALNGLSILNFLPKYVDRSVLNISYKLYVRPHLDYGDVIYPNQRADMMNCIEQVPYKAGLIVSEFVFFFINIKNGKITLSSGLPLFSGGKKIGDFRRF